jgi:type II secretory pathway component GspD/PulD (secretin)
MGRFIRTILLFAFLLAGVDIAATASETKTEAEASKISEVFSYQLDDLKAVKNALEQVVSSDSKVIFLYDKRKVMVQDSPGHFEMIRAIMQEFKPVETQSVLGPMVQVELFFNENASGSERGVSVDGRVQSGGVSVGTIPGSGNKIRVNAVDRNMMSSSNQTAFIMVQSGSWSRLNVSREVSRPAYFYDYLSAAGYFKTGITMERRNVGTMLEVSPVVRGRLVDLIITPVITSIADGRTLDFKVRELSTRVTLASGAKVQLGGFAGAQDEFNRLFFGGSRRNTSSQTGFAVRATVQGLGR